MVSSGNKLPKSKFKPNIRPYWNDNLRVLKKIKVINFRKWVAKGRPKNDDNPEWINHKHSKKAFRKELKYVQREFERKELNSILASAECDKNKFWRLIKKSRKSPKSSSIAVKKQGWFGRP